LLELQKIDAVVFELRSSIAALPEKLAPAKADLAKLESMLQVERDRLAETEGWRREQEQMISQDQEDIQKAKGKLQASKNSKDFAAASREVDNKRRSMSEREEEVLKVIEALEKSRTEIAAHEKDVEALRATIEAEEAKVGVQIEDLTNKATEASSGRAEIAAKVEKSLLKKYDYIVKFRGIAVAPVVDGTCQGCHMSVPPQLNNILARGDSIESCPRCQRLLFREDAFTDGGSGSDEAAS
jgi:predicted  nucleic acid-binding Zn-ribbon protein